MKLKNSVKSTNTKINKKLLGGHSLPKPLKSKTRKAAAVLIVVMALSAFIIVYYPFYVDSVLPHVTVIRAEKLAEKPSNYTLLNNPDPYVSQAITNLTKQIRAPTDKTQINKSTYPSGSGNFEINGSYYAITAYGIIEIDSAFELISPLYLLSFKVLPIAIIMLLILLTAEFTIKLHLKKKNKNLELKSLSN